MIPTPLIFFRAAPAHARSAFLRFRHYEEVPEGGSESKNWTEANLSVTPRKLTYYNGKFRAAPAHARSAFCVFSTMRIRSNQAGAHPPWRHKIMWWWSQAPVAPIWLQVYLLVYRKTGIGSFIFFLSFYFPIRTTNAAWNKRPRPSLGWVKSTSFSIGYRKSSKSIPYFGEETHFFSCESEKCQKLRESVQLKIRILFYFHFVSLWELSWGVLNWFGRRF